jgi:hypothetical protein
MYLAFFAPLCEQANAWTDGGGGQFVPWEWHGLLGTVVDASAYLRLLSIGR